MQKGFWKSKTFWVNLFAIAAIFSVGGKFLTAENQVALLAVINIILRFISHDGVGFSEQ